MPEVVQFDADPTRDKMLEALDELRAGIVAGKYVSFGAVAIKPDAGTEWFSGCSRSIPMLQLIGAVSMALHKLNAGEIG